MFFFSFLSFDLVDIGTATNVLVSVGTEKYGVKPSALACQVLKSCGQDICRWGTFLVSGNRPNRLTGSPGFGKLDP